MKFLGKLFVVLGLCVGVLGSPALASDAWASDAWRSSSDAWVRV